MPILSQIQIAEQMVAQLRLLKPSISAEVGTPERLILDTVAGAISESSIDLIGLQSALNVDSKFGTNLTNFLALFGFERQQASFATGFVEFTRNSPANVDLRIPAGVIVKSHISPDQSGLAPEFETTAAVTLAKGETATPLVPVKARSPGSKGDVPAGAISILVFSAAIPGVTGVNNPSATTGGSDQEDDNSLKVRFKNTVFRNLAGTEDQFLALAVATAFSTKAVVIGPISRYQEYFEVPKEDDTHEYPFGGNFPYSGVPFPIMVRSKAVGKIVTVLSTINMKAGDKALLFGDGPNPEPVFNGTIKAVLSPTEIELSGAIKAVEVQDGWFFVGTPDPTLVVNQWTTALSSNPFAKEIWAGLPIFVSNITSGISKFFFREGVDYNFNFPAVLQGDTLRAMIDETGPDPRTDKLGHTQPNITFTNVLLVGNEAVKAVQPKDILLVEYPFVSSSSRNSIEHNITNAVDVFVDGTNEQPTSTIFATPLSPANFRFVDNPVNAYYLENYRRVGEPTKRPLEGNVLTTLFNVPVLKLPQQITVGSNKYYLDTHYWLAQETDTNQGTIRARDGIEWSATIRGDKGGAGEGVPTPAKPEPEYTGQTFEELGPEHLVEIEPYFYDQNIEDLQAALELNRQITTDVLAHKAHLRWFKLDITVVYGKNTTASSVNNQIRESIAAFFANQYFGSVIRLSDLLQQIHNVAGVENVRWSNDIPNDKNLVRVFETNIEGEPLRGVFSDRLRWGREAGPELDEIQALYIVGNPVEGKFKLQYGTKEGESETGELDIGTVTAEQLQTAIRAALKEVPAEVTVTEDVRSNINVASSIRSFRIEYHHKGPRRLPIVNYEINQPVKGGEFAFDSDFFLRDDELPALPTGLQEGDTVPGFIIRSRAENVFQKA